MTDKFDVWDDQSLSEIDGALLVTHPETEDDELIWVGVYEKRVIVSRTRKISLYENMHHYTTTDQYEISLGRVKAQSIIDNGYSPLFLKVPKSTDLVYGTLSVDGETDEVLFTADYSKTAEFLWNPYVPLPKYEED